MGFRCEISRSLLDAIIADCAADPARERCGLLFGGGELIEAFASVPNVDDEPEIAFELDPAALLDAHRAARAGGPGVIGHYHSHPGGRPVPSPRDAQSAAPDGSLWLVVAGYHARLWRAGYDGPVQGRFEPVELVVGPACVGDSPGPQARPDAKGNFMTISPVDFASLLCSRLCHDLLSPVGALNNGLELLADETDPEMRQRCLELLNESARTSANKLKFFRLAFGAAGGFGDLIDTREARAAIEGLFGDGKRVTPQWLVEDEQLSKAAIKVLMNLSLIAGDALVRGGQLAIGAESANGQVEIVIRAEGPRIVLDAELRRTLLDGAGEEPVGARSAAAFLVHTLVAEGGGSVQVSEPGEGVLLFGATLAAG